MAGASNMSVVAVPGLGDVWSSGEEVRLGNADDADAVAPWRSDSAAVNGALTNAVDVLRNGSSDTMVYVVDDAQVPIGALTIGWKAPYLQLVFIDEPYRQSDVGTKATCVVVDEFFQSRPEEQWLGVTTPISAAGERLLLRLGFSSSGSGMRITRDAWEAATPAIALFFAPHRAGDPAPDDGSTTTLDQEDDDVEDKDAPRIAIDAHKLHIVSDEDARARFHALLGKGPAWSSAMMQYRTTSDWQDDWVIEVGNWLARADALGYLDVILRNVQPLRTRIGTHDGDEGDGVHRKVTQQLAQAMAVHYFLGIGWSFGAFEPKVTELRASGIPADVDLQLYAPTGVELVDMQVKASGTLGLHDSVVDPQISTGVTNAIAQLPVAAARPSLVVMCAQRWPLSGDTHVLETMIGSTTGYGGGRVLLHDDAYGELAKAPHVSGIAMLDYRRGAALDYGCSVLMNPWATHRIDPAWFPHSRVLSCTDHVFTWVRGDPDATYFSTGTRFAPGLRGSAL
jgi:hypothetical protein